MDTIDFDTFKSEFDRLKVECKLVRNRKQDRPASRVELREAERQLRCKLGAKYAAFLLEYGGGNVGSENIYSVQPGSRWNIVDMHKDRNRIRSLLSRNTVDKNKDRGPARFLLNRGYLAFSENGCGDYYVFRIENGQAQEKVLWWDHETDTICNLDDIEAEDILDLIIFFCTG